jgi:hypothetical protein
MACLRVQGGVGCPALPFGFCPRLWDEAHVPGAEEDDAAIYAEALARRRHWPLWLPIVRPPSACLLPPSSSCLPCQNPQSC